jgi:hypothetical protein
VVQFLNTTVQSESLHLSFSRRSISGFMTQTAPPKPPLPFIADHRLIALVKQSPEATLDEQRAWLRPETFRWLRDTGKNEKPTFGLSPNWEWQPVENRTEFLSSLQNSRIVITDNAGCGKTAAARQMQYLLHQTHLGHLAILVNFSELPEEADAYLGHKPEQSQLVHWFRTAAETTGAQPQAVSQLIQQKLRMGQLTLIVEAFDQTTSASEASPTRQAKALRDFLIRYPSIRCVCTGRPQAILERHLHALFADEEWLFVQIDAFNEKQAEKFVGAERWQHCQQLEVSELVVPRSLEAIRLIPVKELLGIRTLSQIYWRSLLHTLELARVHQDENTFSSKDGSWTLTKSDAVDLLALLAFECNRQGFLNGVKSGEPFRQFLKELWLRHGDVLKEEFELHSRRAFENRLVVLNKLNVAMEFAALDHVGITQVTFQNRTLQEFFAAIWMCTRATPDNRTWFSQQRFVRADKSTETFYQMWKLAAEMPDEPRDNMLARTSDGYADAMRVLYVPDAKDPWQTVRSTEMIWRSWPTMLQLAGLLDGNLSIEDATLAAQKEAFRLMGYPTLLGRKSELEAVPDRQANNWSSDQEKNVARRAVLEYLTEYPGILAGQRTANSNARFAKRSPVEIAWEFEQGFRLCPKGYDLESDLDARKSMLQFVFGDNGVVEQLPKPLFMHRYQVTNELYEIFDGQHFDETSRNLYNHPTKNEDGPSHPVTYVDWYDSWCLALWSGGCLPGDFEWEFSCRAGTSTKFWSGPDDRDMVGSFSWNKRAGWIVDRNPGTSAVGTYKANAWQLHDTHGNVEEWCRTCYATAAMKGLNWGYLGSDRCFRGGNFTKLQGDCRSAAREWAKPSASSHRMGVRVSRVAAD